MPEVEQTTTPKDEYDQIKGSLESIEEETLPIIEEISYYTRKARRATGGPQYQPDGTTKEYQTDTLVLSQCQVQLSILNQRLSERISMMGYTTRSAEEFYKRQMEGHKVRLTQVGEERVVDGKKKMVTVAAGVADSMKIGLVSEEFELYNQCQYRLDQFKGAWKSNDKTIDTIRSKVSYEKSNEYNA